MLKYALELASRGIAVFPLSPNSKIPTAQSKGVKDATTDQDEIRRMWLRNPNCNLGVALGAVSGLIGVDLDYNHGATDEDLRSFPQTVTVKTRNGFHLYYKHVAGIKNQVLIPARNGLGDKDKAGAAYLRSDGYYLVGPGSTVAGHRYEFHELEGLLHSFDQLQLMELPNSFLTIPIVTVSIDPPASVEQHVSQAGVANLGGVPQAESIGRLSYPPNTRHAMLLRTATAMRKKGKSSQQIFDALHERNLKDCVPPKDQPDKEINNIVKWAWDNVQPAPIAIADEAGDYLMPLGHLGTDYYYTSNSNRQIVCISRASHTAGVLCDLMPNSWWRQRYPSANGQGASWQEAASDLMEACREVGIFDEKKMRGLGCWQENGKLIIHLGEKLLIDGQEKPLNANEGKHIYALCPSIEPPHVLPAGIAEGKKLIEVCESFAWKDKHSGVFLAGALSILRLCGALPWRPMVWLTGPSGSGKSTIMEQVVNRIAGSHAVYILGNTTEAGIRQELGSNALPVIFDEAETNDKRSANRMKAVLELVRQASSDSEGRILKGTADGKGHNFKISSSFFLASIRYNLTEEADKNRFTVLELERNDPKLWPDIKRKIDAVTNEFGDRLFARVVGLFPVLMQSRAVLEERISAKHSRRTAQQYGIMLAGYHHLGSDEAITAEQADALIKRVGLEQADIEEAEDSKDEVQALDHLLAQVVTVTIRGDRQETSISNLVHMAQLDENHRLELKSIGLDRNDSHLQVAVTHPMVKKLFFDTKWQDSLIGTMARLQGATVTRHQFEMRKLKSVRVPMTSVFPPA
jgi:energy-coupling factor transporter ATP-binding protein EcfA2